MGLFSFLKNAGAKLFGKKKTVAPMPTVDHAEIERKQKVMLLNGIIDTLGLPNENISISMEGTDVVVLSGTCETQADKEKIILALGNVDGIAFVDDRVSVTNPTPPAVFYTVTKNDTLGKIAKAQYGDAMKYPVIFEANKPMLSHPDKIYPGQVLRIPPVEGTYSASIQGGATASTYTVQSGDTLGKIAKEIYGDAMKYKAIFEANTDTLKNPDAIRVGQVLNIPSANNLA
ncbi:MAG: nucleoid-associated protein YgaU [Saprospiraceae bacterium]|jgi:nucleoid-associated protein YgaU